MIGRAFDHKIWLRHNMFEDRLLIRKIKRGDSCALHRIYEKYGDGLLMLAAGLLRDISAAEDILHDVFVSFVEKIQTFELKGSLRAYLSVCVINKAKDRLRAKKEKPLEPDKINQLCSQISGPDDAAASSEDVKHLIENFFTLSSEQQEAIMLHLNGGMKFRQIAEVTGISINTIQGRYRQGIQKLRQISGVRNKNEL